LPSTIPVSCPVISHGISRFAKCHSEEAAELEQVNWGGCLVAPSALQYASAGSLQLTRLQMGFD